MLDCLYLINRLIKLMSQHRETISKPNVRVVDIRSYSQNRPVIVPYSSVQNAE